jgi:hypothetical protein
MVIAKLNKEKLKRMME